MKTLLFFIVFVFAASATQAKCYTRSITCWPLGKTIKQNPVFVLDGMDESQALIRGLGTSCKAYLIAGGEKVPLEVLETLEGEYHMTQAVLQPKRPLAVGKQYQLVVLAPHERGNKGVNNLLYTHSGTILYTVVAGTDEAAPVWRGAVKEQAKRYEEFGCGPEVFVDFSFSAQDESACLIKASVKSLVNGKTTSYYLRATREGVVSVGHNMCAGPFAFQKGKAYSVTFALMDASGNSLPWTGKAIAFTRPEIQG